MVVLTRSEVLDVRALVTVAEITTTRRGLATEVPIDHAAVGLDRESSVNCDGLHTIAQSTLTAKVGALDDHTMDRICSATAYALGC